MQETHRRTSAVHPSVVRLRYYSRTGLLLHNHFSWLLLTRLEVPWNPPPPPHNTTDSSISWYESSGARSRATRPYWSRSSSQRQPITTSRIKKCVVRTAVRRQHDMSVTTAGWEWVATIGLCIHTGDGNPFINLSHWEISLKTRCLFIWKILVFIHRKVNCFILSVNLVYPGFKLTKIKYHELLHVPSYYTLLVSCGHKKIPFRDWPYTWESRCMYSLVTAFFVQMAFTVSNEVSRLKW